MGEKEAIDRGDRTWINANDQVVSETPGVRSVVFDATEWAYEQVPRQTGAVEGFGDLGTIFFAEVELPAGFGTPGNLPFSLFWYVFSSACYIQPSSVVQPQTCYHAQDTCNHEGLAVLFWAASIHFIAESLPLQ